MPAKTQLRAVIYQEGPVWIAQGLEIDITAQSDSLPDLPSAFVRAVAENFAVAHHLGHDPLSSIGPAPERFERMFERARMFVGVEDGDDFVPGDFGMPLPRAKDVKMRVGVPA